MGDIFSGSISALNAAQAGLATTQNNIANANTPGYNREVNIQIAAPAQNTGSGFIGQGVEVTTVQRMYNQFLSNQVTQQTGQSSQLNTYYSQIQQINNMLADPTSGVQPALQNFFNAVNGVASSPQSMPARQTMVSTAQSLSTTFQSLSQQLTDINTGVNEQITSSVGTINGYAQQIAALNQNIKLDQSSTGQPPNSLMDQRDALVSQLNQQVGTTVVQQGDGSYNVFIGGGQPLVVGSTAYSLHTVQSQSNPSELEVAGSSSAQLGSIQGGALGGLMAFRDQTLTQTQNMLGLVATGVAGTFNQQNALGQDLNGNMASSTNSFFTDPKIAVIPNTANTGTVTSAAITPTITDYSKLTGSNYSLAYDGTNYTLTNTSTNQVVPTVTTTVGTLTTIAANQDGISITIPAGAKAGDSFLIQPTINGAANISVAVTDPAKIAAAAPVVTNAPTTNSGTATISAGAVDATYSALGTAATLPVTLTYASGAPSMLTFPGSTTVPVTVSGTPPITYPVGTTSVPYTDGATINYGGASFTITGTPVNGDTFTLAQNTNAPTDNRNALLLAGLQTQNTMQGGTSNYVGVYGQLVSQVGNQTNNLNVTSTAQTTLLNNTIAAQQSVSGVNLDEEAANLLRYQQAYQAAGKAMQVASTLFDTLLSIGK
jgi:flagellar hook-associated protein 1 FlgK